MSGKQSLNNQIIEELMEGQAYFDDVPESLDKIIGLIDKNEEGDHNNDVTRREVISALLSALRSLDCKDANAASNFIHTALQKINEQERLDLADDKPRIDARIALAVLRQKSITIKEDLAKLTERFSHAK